MPKGDWKEYFAFTKRERTAVFILLGLIAIFIFFSFFWYQPVFTKPTIDAKVQQQLNAISSPHHNYIDSSDEDTADSTKEAHSSKAAATQHELFYFDPNTLDSTGWRRLGFGEKTVEHILEYRRSKGKFTKPEDLYNTPRIRKKSVAAVIPYMRIGSGITQSVPKNTLPTTTSQIPTPVAANYKTIFINSATAEDFKIFPGVTDAVAARIIKFRTSINGFKSIDDVAKTYGLPSASFNIMRPYLKL